MRRKRASLGSREGRSGEPAADLGTANGHKERKHEGRALTGTALCLSEPPPLHPASAVRMSSRDETRLAPLKPLTAPLSQ
ncbi:hypothetical protein AAFF_G00300450 [Aldrovandia affinis]|uniref:Uncharacterized protein n=1 Tax=Aldrovandia affinis TaxID=143900 RepID=A0AAD7SPW6_9TELE|nr:hypothetical protein AAFF_G00300450 [Aldrovandia affinis]